MGMVGFWFLEVTSLLWIVTTLNYFISGQMFPLDLLPRLLGDAAQGRCRSSTWPTSRPSSSWQGAGVGRWSRACASRRPGRWLRPADALALPPRAAPLQRLRRVMDAMPWHRPDATSACSAPSPASAWPARWPSAPTSSSSSPSRCSGWAILLVFYEPIFRRHQHDRRLGPRPVPVLRRLPLRPERARSRRSSWRTAPTSPSWSAPATSTSTCSSPSTSSSSSPAARSTGPPSPTSCRARA